MLRNQALHCLLRRETVYASYLAIRLGKCEAPSLKTVDLPCGNSREPDSGQDQVMIVDFLCTYLV